MMMPVVVSLSVTLAFLSSRFFLLCSDFRLSVLSGQLFGLLFAGAALRGLVSAVPACLIDDSGVWIGAELFHCQVRAHVVRCRFKALGLGIENEYGFKITVRHF